MSKFKITSVALRAFAILVLASAILSLDVSSARTNSQTHWGPQMWVGCWKSGDYSLYIGRFGDRLKGKIRHGNIGREDPQEIYDCQLAGNTLTGKWRSDPEYKNGGDKGVRRGTFVITLVSKNRIEGVSHEGSDSEVQENRGKDWPWNFDRQTGTNMCKVAKNAME